MNIFGSRLHLVSLQFVTLVCGFVALNTVGVTPAQAQVARLSKVQATAEKRAGAEGAWQKVALGTGFQVDDRLRTGRRAKADVKFPDGSLLRLGQLSSVEFRSTKGVTLTGGQLLFAALKPGRVLAGTATAEITGSVALVSLNEDGSSDFSLFSGAMSVNTPQGRVDLKPGQSVTAREDGTLSAVRATAPFAFMDNTPDAELAEGPSNSPSVGSRTATRERTEPGRSGTTQPTTTVATDARQGDIPLVPIIRTPVTPPNPFPTPFPTVPPGLARNSKGESFSLSRPWPGVWRAPTKSPDRVLPVATWTPPQRWHTSERLIRGWVTPAQAIFA